MQKKDCDPYSLKILPDIIPHEIKKEFNAESLLGILESLDTDKERDIRTALLRLMADSENQNTEELYNKIIERIVHEAERNYFTVFEDLIYIIDKIQTKHKIPPEVMTSIVGRYLFHELKSGANIKKIKFVKEFFDNESNKDGIAEIINNSSIKELSEIIEYCIEDNKETPEYLNHALITLCKGNRAISNIAETALLLKMIEYFSDKSEKPQWFDEVVNIAFGRNDVLFTLVKNKNLSILKDYHNKIGDKILQNSDNEFLSKVMEYLLEHKIEPQWFNCAKELLSKNHATLFHIQKHQAYHLLQMLSEIPNYQFPGSDHYDKYVQNILNQRPDLLPHLLATNPIKDDFPKFDKPIYIENGNKNGANVKIELNSWNDLAFCYKFAPYLLKDLNIPDVEIKKARDAINHNNGSINCFDANAVKLLESKEINTSSLVNSSLLLASKIETKQPIDNTNVIGHAENIISKIKKYYSANKKLIISGIEIDHNTKEVLEINKREVLEIAKYCSDVGEFDEAIKTIIGTSKEPDSSFCYVQDCIQNILNKLKCKDDKCFAFCDNIEELKSKIYKSHKHIMWSNKDKRYNEEDNILSKLKDRPKFVNLESFYYNLGKKLKGPANNLTVDYVKHGAEWIKNNTSNTGIFDAIDKIINKDRYTERIKRTTSSTGPSFLSF